MGAASRQQRDQKNSEYNQVSFNVALPLYDKMVGYENWRSLSFYYNRVGEKDQWIVVY
jgi:hypothetical protein